MKKLNKEKLENVSGCSMFLIVLMPFIFLLLALNALEPFIFWGTDNTPFHFTLFIALAFASYVFLYLFFIVAKTWHKWLMYLYIAILVIQTGSGLMYKYYKPPLERFSLEEISSIKGYIKGNENLPKNMEVLVWNDSVGIIGKKAKNGIWEYHMNRNLTLKNEQRKNFLNDKCNSPVDFHDYFKLLGVQARSSIAMVDFWSLQYPREYIFIYIKNCDCGIDENDSSPCYKYFDELFVPGFGTFRPIILEIFNGKLGERYSKFYKFFQKLWHPTYVRTDLANDPYFLIYQGKYKEAREGLKNLPAARREFCRKKLEALGY